MQTDANCSSRGCGSWMVLSPSKNKTVCLWDSSIRGIKRVVPSTLGGLSVRQKMGDGGSGIRSPGATILLFWVDRIPDGVGVRRSCAYN